MDRRTRLTCSLILVLSHSVYISYSAETPSDFSIGETPLISYPATDKSVEAGLLKIREGLRDSPEFQTNDAPTHRRSAKTLSQQGDPSGAIEEYQIALSLDPMLAGAYRELGAVYIDTHE